MRQELTVLVDDLDLLAHQAHGAGRRVGNARQRDAALGRAEGVDHLHAEAPGELLDDLR